MPGGEGWGGPPLHRTPCSGRSEKFHVVHNLQFGICIQDPYLWRAPFWPPIKGSLILLDLNVSSLLPRLSLQGLRQQLLSKLQTKLEVNNKFFDNQVSLITFTIFERLLQVLREEESCLSLEWSLFTERSGSENMSFQNI